MFIVVIVLVNHCFFVTKRAAEFSRPRPTVYQGLSCEKMNWGSAARGPKGRERGVVLGEG